MFRITTNQLDKYTGTYYQHGNITKIVIITLVIPVFEDLPNPPIELLQTAICKWEKRVDTEECYYTILTITNFGNDDEIKHMPSHNQSLIHFC